MANRFKLFLPGILLLLVGILFSFIISKRAADNSSDHNQHSSIHEEHPSNTFTRIK